MTKNNKDRFQQVAEDFNLNLGNLFGSLGEAVNDIVARLDDGKSGEVMREHVFDTEKGPVRAQAGIRVRVGGLEQPQQPSKASPINRPRKPAAQPATPRSFSFDLFEDADLWVLSADLPGATASEIVLRAEGDVLVITTTGERKYAANVTLAGGFDVDRTTVSLRNGILELQIPKVTQA